MKQPLLLCLLAAGTAHAQAPTITALSPLANAGGVARTSAVTVSFSQPLTAASAGSLAVYSAQRGGLRTRGGTPATVNGATLGFAPAPYPFVPGETVQYTVTRAATSGGGALAQPWVGQFTTAVGGSGTGNFLSGLDFAVGNSPRGVAVGDIDGDGDLDLLTANTTVSQVSVRLNDGAGAFSGSQEVDVSYGPRNVVLGDIDGDGDLDLLASSGASVVSVRVNNGSGLFSGNQNVSMGGVGGSTPSVALGDVDGDGDLDLLASSGTGQVGVRLNNGLGVFSNGQNFSMPGSLVALGDVDNDGDLDALAAAYGDVTAGFVEVRLNDGNGAFSGSQRVTIGPDPQSITLGDVDGDGDLDVVTANLGSYITASSVSVRLNNGSGTFSGNQNISVGGLPAHGVVLGDVDNDADLDLLVTAFSGSGAVSLRRNDGSGFFSGGQPLAVGSYPYGVALGDLDGDGDLDLVSSNNLAYLNDPIPGSVSVRLNSGTALATAVPRAMPFALFPVPARAQATVTGAVPLAALTVLDALGRVQLTARADATGTAHLVLLGTLPAGVYLVRSGAQVRRLTVE